ncbi:hypothetical protein MPH_07175 [Macrophomina phaseolina MS6]|uniref:Uncharacterized protein n=1 Tax=Macrophomina phaseolina (strain MS6) TaxID=1126212 RepID=K2SFZ4_MACPH|nr:hypothetical protein MPH_07175 [Macrophomina phaseolina MS6]
MSSMTGEGLLRTTEQSTRPFQDSLRSGSLRPPPNSPSIRSSQSSIHFFTPLDRFANGFLPSSPVRPSQVFGEIADLGRPVQPTLSLPARHHELQSLLGQDEETGLLPRPRQDSGHEDLDGEENEVKTVRSFVFGGRLIPRTRSSISRPACHFTSLMAENVRRLLTTNLYHTSGLVFVPLGFISHSLGWDQATVVALNALAAGACAFLATALFEHLRPTWHAQVPKSSLIGDIVWTNPAWLCVGHRHPPIP